MWSTILLRAAGMALLASAALAQREPAGPSFEVASIKPGLSPAAVRAQGRMPVFRIDGARVDMESVSLAALIRMAYQMEPYQVSGPDWMVMGSFDLQAKLPDGATKEQVPAMLQALLAERFKLVVRRESREQPVYALLVGKDGPKLKESAPGAGASDKPFPNGAGGRILLMLVHGENGLQTTSVLKGETLFEADKITLPELAVALMRYVDVPVVDLTGLRGFYQVAMNVPNRPNASRVGARGATGMGGRDPDRPAGDASDPSGVSIFASVEKLGLRLERRKAPVEHLVVEHLEKTPTEN